MPDAIAPFYASAGYKKEESAPLVLKNRYIEMDAMHFWGKDPDKWRSYSPWDRAEMMAFAHTKRGIDGYQMDWSRMHSENNKPKT